MSNDPRRSRWPVAAPIRAVVLDVDGTLLARDGTISEANRRAVARVTQLGVPVILATGRIPTETVGYYRELALATPLVCYHGALVLASGPSPVGGSVSADWVRAARLVDAPLPEPVVRDVTAFILAQHADAQILLGLEDRYVINRMGELARHWDMSGPSRPQVGPLDAALVRRVYKICCFSPDLPRVAETARRVEEAFAGAVCHQQAHAHLAEFLAAGVSKAAGAEAALAAVGCDWSHVLAVGDYHNDAAMIERAAVGVAMGNAPQALKATADWVAPDRDADGVAAALDRFV